MAISAFPFRGVPECPKCGHGYAGNPPQAHYQVVCLADGHIADCLLRTCRICGVCWVELCQDQKGLPKEETTNATT